MKTSYLNLLSKSKETQSQEDLQFRVEDAELQLNSDILATKRAISKAKKDYEKVIIAEHFNSQNILDAKENIKSLESGLTELESLKKELFS